MLQVVEPKRSLLISIHDVSPSTWSACARLLDLVDEIGGGPLTLLVVPEYQRQSRCDEDCQFMRAVERRLARGDEVALHGYYHIDERPVSGPYNWLRRRVYTAGEGEFSALDWQTAHTRLERGLKLMTRLGWPVHGFVAPAWMMGSQARLALTELPFTYTSTLRSMHHLPAWESMRVPSLVYSTRSAWRCALSRRCNARMLAHADPAPVLRAALHPTDANYPAVLAEWRCLLTHALATRQPMTKSAWVKDWPWLGVGSL